MSSSIWEFMLLNLLTFSFWAIKLIDLRVSDKYTFHMKMVSGLNADTKLPSHKFQKVTDTHFLSNPKTPNPDSEVVQNYNWTGLR